MPLDKKVFDGSQLKYKSADQLQNMSTGEQQAYAQGYTKIINPALNTTPTFEQQLQAQAEGESSLSAYQQLQASAAQNLAKTAAAKNYNIQNPNAVRFSIIDMFKGRSQQPNAVSKETEAAAKWYRTGKTGQEFAEDLAQNKPDLLPDYQNAFQREYMQNGGNAFTAMDAAQAEIEGRLGSQRDEAQYDVLKSNAAMDIEKAIGYQKWNTTLTPDEQKEVLDAYDEAGLITFSGDPQPDLIKAIQDKYQEIQNRRISFSFEAEPFTGTNTQELDAQHAAKYNGDQYGRSAQEINAELEALDEEITLRALNQGMGGDLDDETLDSIMTPEERERRESLLNALDQQEAYESERDSHRWNYDISQQITAASNRLMELNNRKNAGEDVQDEIDATSKELNDLFAQLNTMSREKMDSDTRNALEALRGTGGTALEGAKQGLAQDANNKLGLLQFLSGKMNNLAEQLGIYQLGSMMPGMRDNQLLQNPEMINTAQQAGYDMLRGRLQNDIAEAQKNGAAHKQAVADSVVNIAKSYWDEIGAEKYVDEESIRQICDFAMTEFVEATGIQVGQQAFMLIGSAITGGAGEGLKQILSSSTYWQTFLGDFAGNITSKFDEARAKGEELTDLDVIFAFGSSVFNAYLEHGLGGDEAYRAGITTVMRSIGGEIKEEVLQDKNEMFWDFLADVVQRRESDVYLFSTDKNDRAFINFAADVETAWKTALTTLGMDATHAATIGVIQKLAGGGRATQSEREQLKDVTDKMLGQDQETQFEAAANGEDNVTDKTVEETAPASGEDADTLPDIEDNSESGIRNEELESEGAVNDQAPVQHAESASRVRVGGSMISEKTDEQLLQLATNPNLSSVARQAVQEEMEARGLSISEELGSRSEELETPSSVTSDEATPSPSSVTPDGATPSPMDGGRLTGEPESQGNQPAQKPMPVSLEEVAEAEPQMTGEEVRQAIINAYTPEEYKRAKSASEELGSRSEELNSAESETVEGPAAEQAKPAAEQPAQRTQKPMPVTLNEGDAPSPVNAEAEQNGAEADQNGAETYQGQENTSGFEGKADQGTRRAEKPMPVQLTEDEQQAVRKNEAAAEKNHFKIGAVEGDGSGDTGVHLNDVRTELSEQQVQELTLIDRVAKKFGFAVEVSDRLEMDANGKFVKRTGRTVYLSANAQNALQTVASHEMYHMVKNASPKAAERIERIFDQWAESAEGFDLEAEIDKIVNRYARQGVTLDRAAAKEELIANSMYSLMSDEQTLRRVYAEDRTLFTRVMEFVEKLRTAIREMLEDYADSTPEARMLREQEGALSEMHQAMLDALEQMKKLDDAKKAATAVKANGDMTRRFDAAVNRATSSREIIWAGRELAAETLQATGNQASEDNVTRLMNAAQDVADLGTLPGQAMRDNGLNYAANSAEVNRSLQKLGGYIALLKKNMDLDGFNELVNGLAGQTMKDNLLKYDTNDAEVNRALNMLGNYQYEVMKSGDIDEYEALYQGEPAQVTAMSPEEMRGERKYSVLSESDDPVEKGAIIRQKYSEDLINGSIKLQMYEHWDEIKKMVPVYRVNPDVDLTQYNKAYDTRTALRNRTIDFADKIKQLLHRAGMPEIVFNKNKVNKNNHLSNTDMRFVEAVPSVVEKGMVVNEHNYHKGGNDIEHSITFAAPVDTTDDGIKYMGVVVRRIRGTERYYTHKVLLPNGKEYVFDENEKAGLAHYEGSPESNRSNTAPASMRTLPQAEMEVKERMAEKQARADNNDRVVYSLRTEKPPEKVEYGYKAFYARDGKLYPPMVSNISDEKQKVSKATSGTMKSLETPVGVWLDADVGGILTDEDGNPIRSKETGRLRVKNDKSGGKDSSLAFRPGWHLGEWPDAKQFNKADPVTGERGKRMPDDLVFALCEVSADIDYQLDALSYGISEKGGFSRSQAGLPMVPKDGLYKYRTNVDPDTAPWLIAGSMRVVEILDDDDCARICAEHGVTPDQRYSGKKINLADYGLKRGPVTPSTEGMQRFEKNAASRANDELLQRALNDENYSGAYVMRDIDFDNPKQYEQLEKEFAMNGQKIEDYRKLYNERGFATKEQTKWSLPAERNQELDVKSDDGEQLTQGMAGGTVAKYSLGSWRETDISRVRQNLIDKGFDAKDVDKWIEDVNSIAAMIAEDRTRLDYKASEVQTFLKDNAEYVKTLDSSTLCAKRRLYQGTFDAIQHALPNTVITSDLLIHLRNMMAERGYETPCGICYVESRRRNMGVFTERFLKNYEGDSSGYKPTMDDLTTTDGLEALRTEHPEAYEAYRAAMAKTGSNNPKVVQPRTEYRNEIMKLTPSQVQKIIEIGGLRVQSFSDFETPHLIDMMQAVLDMSEKKLTSQAYTKVPNFAAVFGGTGIKFNLSLIADGAGLDENGNLIYSSYEGMDIKEALKLRDQYPDDVGTIIVGVSDEHILKAMASDDIDFIIPFHKSGWGKKQLEQLTAMRGYHDYTADQNERRVVGKTATGKQKIKKVEENFHPVDYWDYSKSGKENAEVYLRMCAEDGRIPKFARFLVNNGDGSYSLQPDGSTDGYWKLLGDFKMYNHKTGKGTPQRAVTPNFNMEEAQRVMNEYEGGADTLPVARDVVDDFVDEYKGEHPRAKFSLPDEDGTQAAREHWDRQMEQTGGESQLMQKLTGDLWNVIAKRKAQQRAEEYGKWRQQVADMAQGIVEDTSSQALNARQIEERLVQIFEDYEKASGSSAEDAENAVNTALNELRGLIGEALSDQVMDEHYREVKDALRKGIYLNPDQVREMGGSAEMRDFRRALTGFTRVYTSEKAANKAGALHLDGAGWEELQALDPDLFNPDLHWLERAQAIRDFVDNHSDSTVRYDAMTADFIRGKALEVLADYHTVSSDNDATTRTRNALKKANQKVASLNREQQALLKTQTDLEAQIRTAKDEAKQARAEAREQVNREIQGYSDTRAQLQQARQEMKNLSNQLSEAHEEVERLQNELENRDNSTAYLENTINQLKRANKKNQEAAVRDDRRRREERAAEVKARQNIKKTEGKMRRMLENPSNSAYVPLDKVRQLLNLVEAVMKADTRKTAQASEKWLRAVRELKEDVSNSFLRDAYDDGFIRQMEDAADILKEKTINQLKGDELQYVSNTLTQALHQIEQATKIIGENRKTDALVEAHEFTETINAQKPQATGGIRKAAQSLVTEHLTPEREFNKLAGYRKDNAIYRRGQALIEGQREANKTKMEMTRFFEPLMTGENRKNFERFQGRKAEIIDTGVKGSRHGTFKITQSTRAALYLHSLNQQNLDGMKNGLTVPDYQLMRQGKTKEAWDRAERMYLSSADLKKILAGMTEYEKAWATAWQGMQKYSTPKLNKVSMDLYGWHKFAVENYFPIRRDKNYLATDFESLMLDDRISNMGFTKARKNASNPMMLEDMFSVVNRTINGTSLYTGMLIPVTNFNKVFNATLPGYEDSPKAALRRVFGSKEYEYIERMMKDVQQAGVKADSSILDRVRSKAAPAALGANLSVVIKQAASYPTAAAELGYQPLLKALTSNRKFDEKLVQKYTSAYWERDSATMQAMNSNTQQNSIDKTSSILNAPISGMDKATVRKIWIACEYAVEEENRNLKRGTDEYWEEVARKYERCLERTQPEYGVMQRPHILRSNNQLMKSVTMYKTQSFQNFNILYDAAADYATQRRMYKENQSAENKAELDRAKTSLARAVSSQVISAAVLALMTAVGKAALHKPEPYQDEKGEVTGESVSYQLSKDALSSMAGMITGGSELFDLIVGISEGKAPYDIEAGAVSMVNDVYQAVYKLGTAATAIGNSSLSTEQKLAKALKAGDTFLQSIGAMFGVPVKNLENIGNSVAKYVDDIVSGRGLEGLTRGDVTLTTAARYMGEALQKGDQETYTRLYNRLLQQGKSAKQIQSAMRTWMKTGDERIRQAAEAIDGGDLDTYNRLINEMTDDGLGMANVVTAIEAVRKANQASASSEESGSRSEELENVPQMTYEEIMAAMDQDEDVYTYAQMNQLLENGNVQAAKKVQSQLFKSKGTTKVKSALTSYWKPKYQEAYKARNRTELNRITRLLKQMGYSDASLAKWKKIESDGGNKNSKNKSSSSRFGGSRFGSKGFGRR